jgi:hypothetical protein
MVNGADEIRGWLAKNGLGEIDGLLDMLLVACDDLSDVKEMEEEDLTTLVAGLALKSVKAKKVAKAFAGLRSMTPAGPFCSNCGGDVAGKSVCDGCGAPTESARADQRTKVSNPVVSVPEYSQADDNYLSEPGDLQGAMQPKFSPQIKGAIAAVIAVVVVGVILVMVLLNTSSPSIDSSIAPAPPPDYCQDKTTAGTWDYSQNFIGQTLGISKALYFTVQAGSDARVAFFDCAIDKDAMPRTEIIISG